ncbi:hypothetical protein [Brevundimonas sp.]
MTKTGTSNARLTPVSLGQASGLTRAEIDGHFAEIGLMRSRTPV